MFKGLKGNVVNQKMNVHFMLTVQFMCYLSRIYLEYIYLKIERKLVLKLFTGIPTSHFRGNMFKRRMKNK